MMGPRRWYLIGRTGGCVCGGVGDRSGVVRL